MHVYCIIGITTGTQNMYRINRVGNSQTGSVLTTGNWGSARFGIASEEATSDKRTPHYHIHSAFYILNQILSTFHLPEKNLCQLFFKWVLFSSVRPEISRLRVMFGFRNRFWVHTNIKLILQIFKSTKILNSFIKKI